MTCLHCNGWGKVLRVNTPADKFTVDYRRAVFKRLTLGRPAELPLAEQVCTACGGYGTTRGD